MLPPFIIEQIRKREEEARRERQAEQPRLELPVDHRVPDTTSDDEPERGVIIVDLG
jgi:hypothetical protein